MVPQDTEAQNSPEDQDAPGHQAPPDTTEPDPAVSNGGQSTQSKKRAAAPPPVDAQADGQSPDASPKANDEHLDSFCRHLLKEGCEWFEKREDIDSEHLSVLQQVASLETFKNTENGFEFKVIFDDDNGKSRERTIQWQVLPPTNDRPEREFISGRSRGFCQKDAAAIVALSAVRGWESINVHGSQKQKDMLWLEAMKLGLKVNGHTPGPEALKQWQEQQATASTAGVTSADKDPAVTVDNNGPSTPPAAPDASPEQTGNGTKQPPSDSAGNDSSAAYFSAAKGDAGQAFNEAAPRAAQQQQPAPATPPPQASRFVGVPMNNSNPSRNLPPEQPSAGRHRDGEGRVPASAIIAQQNRKQANGGRKGGAPTL